MMNEYDERIRLQLPSNLSIINANANKKLISLSFFYFLPEKLRGMYYHIPIHST